MVVQLKPVNQGCYFISYAPSKINKIIIFKKYKIKLAKNLVFKKLINSIDGDCQTSNLGFKTNHF